jgi:hypothetical protein
LKVFEKLSAVVCDVDVNVKCLNTSFLIEPITAIEVAQSDQFTFSSLSNGLTAGLIGGQIGIKVIPKHVEH